MIGTLFLLVVSAPTVWIECGFRTPLSGYEICDVYVAATDGDLDGVEIQSNFVDAHDGRPIGAPRTQRWAHIARGKTKYVAWEARQKVDGKRAQHSFTVRYRESGRSEVGTVTVHRDPACRAARGCGGNIGLGALCVCRAG